MMMKYTAALGTLFALAFTPACASSVDESAAGATGDETQASTEQALTGTTYEVSVPVGDPIAMVSAPYVLVNDVVGDTLHLNAVSSCPTCLTWRNPDQGIARYGGVILGYGQSLTVTPNVAGNSRVSLTYCVATSPRFSRCIATMVYITTK